MSPIAPWIRKLRFVWLVCAVLVGLGLTWWFLLIPLSTIGLGTGRVSIKCEDYSVNAFSGIFFSLNMKNGTVFGVSRRLKLRSTLTRS